MDVLQIACEQRAAVARIDALEAQASTLYAQGIWARYEMRSLWQQADGPDDFATLELAGTARIGQTRACTQLMDSRRMVENYGGTLAALADGLISIHLCDLLLSMTRHCNDDVQAGIEARLLPELLELNTTDARRRIAETILEVEAALDPDAAADREQHAKDRRDVYVRPIEDGMCTVLALLDNLTARRWALDFDELVRAQADTDKRDGVKRSAGQRRADVFAALPSQLLALLQMIAKGDLSTLLELARLNPDAADQLHDLADATSDLLSDDADAAPAPAGTGTATDTCGLSRYALTLALLRLKVRDPRVLNVHVAMETLIDIDARAGWLEGIGPISPYRARCLLPQAPLRRIVTDAQTGLPLRIDHELFPEQALMGDIPADAATARERLLAMLTPVVILDQAQPAHDPNRELHDLVALRDRTCIGIGCTRPAHQCDDDHEIPWPDGPTAEWNLSNKSRRCHLAKHHGWTVVRHFRDGTSSWISPLGHEYTRPGVWRQPAPLPADLVLPEPRLVQDTPGPLTDVSSWDKPLADSVPLPTRARPSEAAVADRPKTDDGPPF